MGLSRRNFLKAAARQPKARLPEAMGILYDATLCIGCRYCQIACPFNVP